MLLGADGRALDVFYPETRSHIASTPENHALPGSASRHDAKDGRRLAAFAVSGHSKRGLPTLPQYDLGLHRHNVTSTERFFETRGPARAEKPRCCKNRAALEIPAGYLHADHTEQTALRTSARRASGPRRRFRTRSSRSPRHQRRSTSRLHRPRPNEAVLKLLDEIGDKRTSLPNQRGRQSGKAA